MQVVTRPQTPFTTQLRAFFPATAKAIAINYLSAAALLLAVYALYALLFRFVPYYQGIITSTGFMGITYTLFGYLLVLPIFYATFPRQMPAILASHLRDPISAARRNGKSCFARSRGQGFLPAAHGCLVHLSF